MNSKNKSQFRLFSFSSDRSKSYFFFFVLALLFFAILKTPTFAARGEGPVKGFFSDELNLTDEQEDQLELLEANHRATMMQSKQISKQLFSDLLRSEMTAEQTEEAMTKIFEQAEAQILKTPDYLLSMLAVLNPEQKKELAAEVEQKINKWADRKNRWFANKDDYDPNKRREKMVRRFDRRLDLSADQKTQLGVIIDQVSGLMDYQKLSQLVRSLGTAWVKDSASAEEMKQMLQEPLANVKEQIPSLSANMASLYATFNSEQKETLNDWLERFEKRAMRGNKYF